MPVLIMVGGRMAGEVRPTKFIVPPQERVEVVNPVADKELKELAEFAAKEENWYHTDMNKIPGDGNEFTRKIIVGEGGSGKKFAYRVVFTHTVDPIGGKIVRHLSISCFGEDKRSYTPGLGMCEYIGQKLGFTGQLHDWLGMEDKRYNETVLVFIQPIE